MLLEKNFFFIGPIFMYLLVYVHPWASIWGPIIWVIYTFSRLWCSYGTMSTNVQKNMHGNVLLHGEGPVRLIGKSEVTMASFLVVCYWLALMGKCWIRSAHWHFVFLPLPCRIALFVPLPAALYWYSALPRYGQVVLEGIPGTCDVAVDR